MKGKEDVDDEMWKVIINEVDEDGDGALNFEEFKRMMEKLVEVAEPKQTMKLPVCRFSDINAVQRMSSNLGNFLLKGVAGIDSGPSVTK
jgi:hypothetical protein